MLVSSKAKLWVINLLQVYSSLQESKKVICFVHGLTPTIQRTLVRNIVEDLFAIKNS
jgi:hypothetical protein